jgi:hypothetical protein
MLHCIRCDIKAHPSCQKIHAVREGSFSTDDGISVQIVKTMISAVPRAFDRRRQTETK